jgi:stage V sporulation protein R
MHRLHEKGLIDDGAFFEFLTSHTNVVAQPGFELPASTLNESDLWLPSVR